jgi:hypothetical protein
MPRKTNKHRDIEIIVSEDAIEEALALWITKHHGIEIDRKSIVVTTSGDKLSVKITKAATKEVAHTTTE